MTAPVLLPQPRRVGAVGRDPLPPQGYRLVVDDDGGTHIDAADPAGRFYAEQTLRQLGPKPAPIAIEDWPDIAVRGVMLDVSRDKVPTVETIEALIDRLAGLKVNHVQLYMEHTFAYAGHDQVWSAASPFTADEIRRLDEFCRARHVELAPNQNCLGHMERWLKFEPYRQLAISPDGWSDARGRRRPPTTLDPANPGSLQLVRGLLAQLLPNFTSGRVNVGLDEPWELADDRIDEYVDYITQLRAAPELDGREMLMWGDIITSHPERAADLPAGVTVCEWGYEANHPFEARAASLADFGLPFWLCPGTSSWNTLVGRWTNMVGDCESAARAAVAHGAAGYLVTDWGDNGHLQYLPVSEPGFAYGAAVAWCHETNHELDLVAALSAHVFADETGELAGALQQLGDVHRVAGAQLPNMSILALPVMSPRIRMGEGVTEGITQEQLAEAVHIIDAALFRLTEARPLRPDAALILDEVRTSARLLRHLITDLDERLIAGGSIDDVHPERREALAADLEDLLAHHRELWLARNRPGGLDDSCSRLQRLLAVYRGSGGK